jgi:hypothetical protein
LGDKTTNINPREEKGDKNVHCPLYVQDYLFSIFFTAPSIQKEYWATKFCYAKDLVAKSWAKKIAIDLASQMREVDKFW